MPKREWLLRLLNPLRHQLWSLLIKRSLTLFVQRLQTGASWHGREEINDRWLITRIQRCESFSISFLLANIVSSVSPFLSFSSSSLSFSLTIRYIDQPPHQTAQMFRIFFLILRNLVIVWLKSLAIHDIAIIFAHFRIFHPLFVSTNIPLQLLTSVR